METPKAPHEEERADAPAADAGRPRMPAGDERKGFGGRGNPAELVELMEFAEALEAETGGAPPPAANGTLLVIPTAHGALHGRLTKPRAADESSGGADAAIAPPALVIIVQTGSSADFVAGDPPSHDPALAAALREQGLTTCVVDLLTEHEAHFADPCNNVPLLTQRLLDCLSLLKRQMRDGEMPQQPICLYGAGHASPVIVRVAGLRDNDVAAVVCRDGLIDLAGVLYLRALSAPLLMLVADPDEKRLAANRRALQELSGQRELRTIPREDADEDAVAALAQTAGAWFARHLAAPPR